MRKIWNVIRRLARTRGSAAPKWYSAEELHEWFISEHWSEQIAGELTTQYAINLQCAFNKGYSMGFREAERQNS